MIRPDLDLAEHIQHFRERIVQDALTEACAAYWIRRATDFENAMPREGDYVGRATEVDLEEQRRRLAEIALACRSHASLMLGGDHDDAWIQ